MLLVVVVVVVVVVEEEEVVIVPVVVVSRSSVAVAVAVPVTVEAAVEIVSSAVVVVVAVLIRVIMKFISHYTYIHCNTSRCVIRSFVSYYPDPIIIRNFVVSYRIIILYRITPQPRILSHITPHQCNFIAFEHVFCVILSRYIDILSFYYRGIYFYVVMPKWIMRLYYARLSYMLCVFVCMCIYVSHCLSYSNNIMLSILPVL